MQVFLLQSRFMPYTTTFGCGMTLEGSLPRPLRGPVHQLAARSKHESKRWAIATGGRVNRLPLGTRGQGRAACVEADMWATTQQPQAICRGLQDPV